MDTKDILLILTTLFVDSIKGQINGTAPADSGSSDINKAFISLSVLGGACLASFIIAKVVDHCYDRAALRDDASDISEHTRQLIRARIALSRFKRPIKDKKKKQKKKSKKETEKNTKMFFKLWSKNAKSRGIKRRQSVIKVEEANAEDKLHINGSLKKTGTHAHAHVTFVDEVGERSNDSNVPVITIDVPTLKPSNDASSKIGANDSPRTPETSKKDFKVTTISGKIAENENSGKKTPRNDNSKTITHGIENTTTPSQTSGRNTPVKESNKTGTPSGRTSPTKENSKQSPLVSAAGKPGNKDGDPPRSSSTSPIKSILKGQPQASTRPKTAPPRRPVSRVVAVKSAVIKTSSAPKSNGKASSRAASAKGPGSASVGKTGSGGKRVTDGSFSQSANSVFADKK